MYRTNSGTVKSNSYSDLFMAASFCAYTRKKKALEILPLISFDNEQLETKFYNNIKTVTSIIKPNFNKTQEYRELTVQEDSMYSDTVMDTLDVFLPFFTQ